MTELEPIDQLHARCLMARMQIRKMAGEIRQRIAVWEPRPMPETFSPPPPPSAPVIQRQLRFDNDAIPGEVLYADEIRRDRKWFR